jgi:hypothetical protein
MDNDAFVDNPHFELSKIIKKIAEEVDEFAYSERTKTIRDTNGNKIGTWEIIGDTDNE